MPFKRGDHICRLYTTTRDLATTRELAAVDESTVLEKLRRLAPVK
jgi:hypothetical protein